MIVGVVLGGTNGIIPYLGAYYAEDILYVDGVKYFISLYDNKYRFTEASSGLRAVEITANHIKDAKLLAESILRGKSPKVVQEAVSSKVQITGIDCSAINRVFINGFFL